MGCQPCDCIWSLQFSSGVCVGIYWITYSLYHPGGTHPDVLFEIVNLCWVLGELLWRTARTRFSSQANPPRQLHIFCLISRLFLLCVLVLLFGKETNQHGGHCAKKPVTTMLTYPWKCTVLHCNHLGNTWKPLVLMTRHFDYCPSASEGDNQSVGSSAPVVSRCFPGGYNVKLYISRGRLAWWLLAFLHSGRLHWERLK